MTDSANTAQQDLSKQELMQQVVSQQYVLDFAKRLEIYWVEYWKDGTWVANHIPHSAYEVFSIIAHDVSSSFEFNYEDEKERTDFIVESWGIKLSDPANILASHMTRQG